LVWIHVSFVFLLNVFRAIFWRMPDLNPPKSTPQFTTAEYSGTSQGDRCVSCNHPITTHYYRVNTRMACEACVQELERQQPKDSHAGYVRGLLFGFGAAIVGMIFYAGFTIVTGIYIGYVSLAVGWLVGKAIMLGSKGIGGRRYQIAAVILTYAAVSVAAVPIMISYYIKTKHESQSIQLRQQRPAANAANDQPEEAQPKPEHSKGALLLGLLMIGLASPFMALQGPLHGIIGLIILMVGIRIAWQITVGSRRADIRGPYESSTTASVR
jgi:NADH:ubiquinone oxidoreductase subunit 6 (subunit J)